MKVRVSFSYHHVYVIALFVGSFIWFYLLISNNYENQILATFFTIILFITGTYNFLSSILYVYIGDDELIVKYPFKQAEIKIVNVKRIKTTNLAVIVDTEDRSISIKRLFMSKRNFTTILESLPKFE